MSLKMFKQYAIYISFVFCIVCSMQGQIRPFGIINSEEKSGIISSTMLKQLLPSILSSAKAPIPSGNTESNDRRQRAILAKNAAFCAYIGKQIINNEIVDLSAAEILQLIDKAQKILIATNTSIPNLSITTPNAYEDWQWRSKELIDLLSAYDILKALNQSDSISMFSALNKLAIFASTFHQEATKSVFGFTFFGTIKNNHSLMTAGAIGMSAVILSDYQTIIPEQQPKIWLQTALGAIEDIMWKADASQSADSGRAGYSEGPHYFRYAMLNMLPFFRAFKHVYPDTFFLVKNSLIRHPFYDKRYRNIAQWIMTIMQPDGTLPAIGDTFMGSGFPELGLFDDQGLVYPYTISALNQQLQSTVDMRANYLSALQYAGYTPQQGLQVIDQAGSAVFRAGNQSDNWYVHINGKHGKIRTSGAGHSQSDAASFLMWTHGRPILLDPGYLQYGMRDLVGQATNHNSILIDGKGPPNGAPLSPGGADVYFRNQCSLPSIQYMDLETSYNEADIKRSFINIEDSFFIISDWIKADKPHSYTFQMHGNGVINGTESTGISSVKKTKSGGNATWERDSAAVDAIIIGTQGAQIKADTAVHEEAYMKTGIHTVIRHITNSTLQAAFGSIIIPRKKSKKQSIKPEIILAQDSLAAIGIEYGSKSFLISLVKSDISLQKIIALTQNEQGFIAYSDATYILMWQGERIDDFVLLLRDGTQFTDAETDYAILSSDTRTTMAISAFPGGFKGYYGNKGVLKHSLIKLIPGNQIDSLGIIDILSDGNIQSWNQDSIVFSGPGEFTILIGKKVNKVKESADKLSSIYYHQQRLYIHQLDHDAQSIRIVSLQGKEIKREILNDKNNGQFFMNVSDIPIGYYNVQVIDIYGFVQQKGLILGY